MRHEKSALEKRILTLNGGSSSIKFTLFEAGGTFRRALAGTLERIGWADARIRFRNEGGEEGKERVGSISRESAASFLLKWLEKRVDFARVEGVGHRVVFGMNRSRPERVTAALLRDLTRFIPFDPDHLPGEIGLMKAVRERHPGLRQVACFDTAFHQTLPRVAKIVPIPRRFEKAGLVRFGFHGLSYSSLMGQLERVGGKKEARGRVILAHLGNGASLAAVRGGKSVDTSMGFTPAAGLVMGTRPGDLDPGVAWHLLKNAGLSPDQYNHLIHHESGLLGVSETSSDMRDLIERERTDVRAAEAVDLFCYQTKKWIGSFAAVLGGMETLVFSGGIGENSSVVRERICEGLGFLGIALDRRRNSKGEEIISTTGSKTTIRVIRTDEEAQIAELVQRVLKI
ncbi:MAG: acetate/propionate family kinase [Elusimicrobia bacterium]|nr:acetate/propionate family kinase [Elusimicrobiota bacterium]